MFRQIFCFVLFVLGFSRLQAFPQKWPQHYHFGTVGSDMDIPCPLMVEDVRWKAQNREDILSDQKTLHLHKVDEYSAGRYTCTDATSPAQTSAVYVLVKRQNSLNISCAADSYSRQELLCSIDHEFAGPVRVQANAYRGVLKESYHENNPVTFGINISSAFCLHGEYTKAFNVTVKVMTEKEYWKTDMLVSMTEIVTPGSPENVRVEGEQIAWSPPSSWPHPTSFFPLLFQVNFKKRNNVPEDHKLEAMTYSKKDIREFKVRCRDLYSPTSRWSAWSPEIHI